MALKTEYLASENAAAERRSRALHRFIVGSPIFLLLAVGLVGHVHPKPYAHPASNGKYDRQVLAYRERVATVEAMMAGPDASTDALESEAARWVAGYDSGSLVAVPPAVYEDHMRDGVRGQIVRAGLALASALNLRAESSLRSGRFEDAGRDALLAAQTAHGLRGFEVQAFLQSLLASRRGLGLLAEAWPHLPPSERTAMRVRLETLSVDGGEIGALVTKDRQQAEDYRLRQRITDPGPTFANMARVSVAAATRSARMTDDRIRSLVDGSP